MPPTSACFLSSPCTVTKAKPLLRRTKLPSPCILSIRPRTGNAFKLSDYNGQFPTYDSWQRSGEAARLAECGIYFQNDLGFSWSLTCPCKSLSRGSCFKGHANPGTVQILGLCKPQGYANTRALLRCTWGRVPALSSGNPKWSSHLGQGHINDVSQHPGVGLQTLVSLTF